ncbi:Uncharacterised protein [Mycolicibacterium vanbaalenii]|uniref:Uncharacterized protein n=1 Tax=Mycolicibacterium vanbaalenii TaxID=110539 RepID=A0A5S9NUR4_MYCVN|nr:ATP-binding protein [Mycolicibacterium vanbaalenii]CAA0094432.1 Uncharacterised protein [Mycolicibacterium vanbaalenii]
MTTDIRPAGPVRLPRRVETFRVQRKPRSRADFYLANHNDNGPFVTPNQALAAHDVAGDRLVLAETTSGVFHRSLITRSGESAQRIRSDHVGDFLTERITRLRPRPPAALPGCEVYASHDDAWRTLPVTSQDANLVIGETAEHFTEADAATIHFVVAFADRPGHSITVEYWPAAAQTYSLESCVDSVVHALGTLAWSDGQRMLITPQVKTLVPDSVSLDEAVSRAFKISQSLLTAPADDADARMEAVQLIQQLLMDPWDVADRPLWFARTYQPDFEAMIQMRQGKTAAAILAAEYLISCACHASAERHVDDYELESEARRFADAMTCYLRAHAGANAINAPGVTSRICNLIFEWVTQQAVRPYQSRLGLDGRKLTPKALDRLDLLVRFAPWLEYYVEVRPKGRLLKIALSNGDLVTTLALVRPRNTYVRVSGRPGVKENSRRNFVDVNLAVMTARYVLPRELVDAIETTPQLMNDLARACEKLYFNPVEARRAVQVLTPVPEIAEVVDQYATLAEADRASINEITVLMDYPPNLPPRLVAVNTSPSSRALVELGGFTAELSEFTLDIERATKFTTSPVWLNDLEKEAASVSVVVGESRKHVPLEKRSSEAGGSMCDSEWIDPDLFRGRRDQLIRLSGIMRAGIDVRPPIAIFGPRRAGKTTLAVHACRRATSSGALSDFVVIDMFSDVDGTRPDGYTERWAAVMAERISVKNCSLGEFSALDPIDVLRHIDDHLDGKLFGIVLDEFDTLLSAEPDSELRRLATRLGKLRWKNLAVIATVQRFHRSSSDLETWEFVECREDLTWRDGLTYFCPPLHDCENSGGTVVPLEAPVVLPKVFTDAVAERVGYRPYFWGRLRAQLENWFVAEEGYAVVDRDLINDVLDNIVTADPFLALPLQSTVGMRIAECRRRDLFSDGERRILAHFANRGRKGMPVEEAVAIGRTDAVSELTDRGYMRLEGKQLCLAIPIFGEFLLRHAGDFDLEADDR